MLPKRTKITVKLNEIHTKKKQLFAGAPDVQYFIVVYPD